MKYENNTNGFDYIFETRIVQGLETLLSQSETRVQFYLE